ncbi:hypothetical protein D4S03_01030, partial [bacterium]
SYLELSYPVQVTALEAGSVPAWCLYAEGDPPSAATCRSANGTAYRMFEYAGNDHGMWLIKPDLTPKASTKTTLEIFLEFLDLTLTP